MKTLFVILMLIGAATAFSQGGGIFLRPQVLTITADSAKLALTEYRDTVMDKIELLKNRRARVFVSGTKDNPQLTVEVDDSTLATGSMNFAIKNRVNGKTLTQFGIGGDGGFYISARRSHDSTTTFKGVLFAYRDSIFAFVDSLEYVSLTKHKIALMDTVYLTIQSNGPANANPVPLAFQGSYVPPRPVLFITGDVGNQEFDFSAPIVLHSGAGGTSRGSLFVNGSGDTIFINQAGSVYGLLLKGGAKNYVLGTTDGITFKPVPNADSSRVSDSSRVTHIADSAKNFFQIHGAGLAKIFDSAVVANASNGGITITQNGDTIKFAVTIPNTSTNDTLDASGFAFVNSNGVSPDSVKFWPIRQNLTAIAIVYDCEGGTSFVGNMIRIHSGSAAYIAVTQSTVTASSWTTGQTVDTNLQNTSLVSGDWVAFTMPTVNGTVLKAKAWLICKKTR